LELLFQSKRLSQLVRESGSALVRVSVPEAELPVRVLVPEEVGPKMAVAVAQNTL